MLVCLVHVTGRVCSSPLHASDHHRCDRWGGHWQRLQWYDHSRLNYAGASMSNVGLSDVTAGGLPLVTAMVLARPSKQGHFPDDIGTVVHDDVTSAHAAAARPDITASSSNSTDDDQQIHRRLTLKLAFCCCWNLMSLQFRSTDRMVAVLRTMTSQQ